MITNIILILILYIISIFITRYLNYLSYKLDKTIVIIPLLWFIPIGGLFTYLLLFSMIYFNNQNKSNWFTGKHW